MTDREINRNQVIMSGIVDSPLQYSHVIFGEKFYALELLVSRKSGRTDRIPVIISENLIDTDKDPRGMYLDIRGQFRSCNRIEDGRSRLILTVFVQDVAALSMPESGVSPVNSIYLDGYISRRPFYRRTPSGRELTEMMMAVNRRNSSDYIPCICWGRNARLAERFPLGTHVHVWGRVQSRIYRKKIISESGDTHISRTAYEISVGRLELPELA